jgi:hypothetical protein
MDSTKFLGICILIGSFIIAGAILWQTNTLASNNRYQIQNAEIQGFIDNPVRIDTKTGEIKSKTGSIIMPAAQ